MPFSAVSSWFFLEATQTHAAPVCNSPNIMTDVFLCLGRNTCIWTHSFPNILEEKSKMPKDWFSEKSQSSLKEKRRRLLRRP